MKIEGESNYFGLKGKSFIYTKKEEEEEEEEMEKKNNNNNKTTTHPLLIQLVSADVTKSYVTT